MIPIYCNNVIELWNFDYENRLLNFRVGETVGGHRPASLNLFYDDSFSSAFIWKTTYLDDEYHTLLWNFIKIMEFSWIIKKFMELKTRLERAEYEVDHLSGVK